MGRVARCHCRNVPRLQPAPGSGYVEVTVTNQGEPIPEALMPRLFEPYSRGEAGSTRTKSSG